ncbi:MAG: hypothetical protein LBT20_08400 [Clostridiales bacterium]|jgi:hypothetical protein|nr:hypothetical protein [Clostridiales bacterium]
MRSLKVKYRTAPLGRKILVFFVLGAVFVSVYYIFLVLPLVGRSAEDAARRDLSEILQKSAYGTEADYEKLVRVVYDGKKNIVLIETNAAAVNALLAQVMRNAEEGLKRAEIRRIDVPIGAFSGLKFLAEKGENVGIETRPKNAVGLRLKSELLNAGSDRTLHRISVVLYAEIGISYFLHEGSAYAECEILIAENLLAGRLDEACAVSGSGVNFIP